MVWRGRLPGVGRRVLTTVEAAKLACRRDPDAKVEIVGREVRVSTSAGHGVFSLEAWEGWVDPMAEGRPGKKRG
jgi:hypothetical protein